MPDPVPRNAANLRRLRTLIVAIPLAVGMGYGLYRRLIVGIEQRMIADDIAKRAEKQPTNARPT